MFKDLSLARGMPRGRTVRGYAVRRLPLGAMLTAMEAVGTAVEALPARLFGDGADAARMLERLKRCDRRLTLRLIGRALAVAPREVVRVAAALLEVDESRLLNDDALGADGLCELLLAWMEVNRIENFLKTARELFRRARRWSVADGSSGSSPAP